MLLHIMHLYSWIVSCVGQVTSTHPTPKKLLTFLFEYSVNMFVIGIKWDCLCGLPVWSVSLSQLNPVSFIPGNSLETNLFP